MARIEVKNAYKIFGHNPRKRAVPLLEKGLSKAEIQEKTGCVIAVNNCSFGVEANEIFVVMGLSGSGKSTLLRLINRLIEPTMGEILIEGENITEASAQRLREMRRTDMSMVFQHFGLLPHRTVLDNVAFGLEIQGVEEQERIPKARNAIELVGLEGNADSMISELSGGKQRVGLARGLATDPHILLMDEAFSALDPLIRTQMQDELLALQAKMQKSILFISHDLDEALKLGDRIAIMKDGLIVQIGTPEEILTQPADDYVASFVENVDRSKVITAGTIMKSALTVEDPKDGVNQAVRVMRQHGLSTVYVVDSERRLKGVVLVDDAVQATKGGGGGLQAVTRDTYSTGPDTPVRDMLEHSKETSIPAAVVDQENRLQGIVTRVALLASIAGAEQ